MAIQRKAENPSVSLQIDEPFHYSLKKVPKKNSIDKGPKSAVALPPVSLRTDLLRTVIAFLVILVVLIGLYLKLR